MVVTLSFVVVVTGPGVLLILATVTLVRVTFFPPLGGENDTFSRNTMYGTPRIMCFYTMILYTKKKTHK